LMILLYLWGYHPEVEGKKTVQHAISIICQSDFKFWCGIFETSIFYLLQDYYIQTL
jgi:hypothetical protein